MSSSTKYIESGIFNDGDIICVPVTFENTGSSTKEGVEITLTIPTGVSFATDTVEKGTFDSGTNVWTVGFVFPNQSISGEFCFTITDGCEGPFEFVFSPDSVCCPDDDDFCVVARGFNCCDLNTCFPDIDGATITDNGDGTATAVNADSSEVDLVTPTCELLAIANLNIPQTKFYREEGIDTPTPNIVFTVLAGETVQDLSFSVNGVGLNQGGTSYGYTWVQVASTVTITITNSNAYPGLEAMDPDYVEVIYTATQNITSLLGCDD